MQNKNASWRNVAPSDDRFCPLTFICCYNTLPPHSLISACPYCPLLFYKPNNDEKMIVAYSKMLHTTSEPLIVLFSPLWWKDLAWKVFTIGCLIAFYWVYLRSNKLLKKKKKKKIKGVFNTEVAYLLWKESLAILDKMVWIAISNKAKTKVLLQ